MHPPARIIIIIAGRLGFTGVALGAFGAHALKEILTARGSIQTWQTAVLYHLVHAVALLALASGSGGLINPRWIALCWSLGVILFSGSLYGLALGGPKVLGPITPLGGLALLSGWLIIAWQGWQLSTR